MILAASQTGVASVRAQASRRGSSASSATPRSSHGIAAARHNELAMSGSAIMGRVRHSVPSLAARQASRGRSSVTTSSSASFVAAAASASSGSSSSGGMLASLKEKVAEKVAADPNFLFKLFVEVRMYL